MSGKLEETNSPYAMAKLSAIEIGDAMSKEFGHDIINLMPTNLYGPNDNFNSETSHVPAALIDRFHKAKLSGESEVVIWGDGKPYREFMHVDDFADACIFILKNLGLYFFFQFFYLVLDFYILRNISKLKFPLF